jgi:AmiR/NasT family two-component response regulator
MHTFPPTAKARVLIAEDDSLVSVVVRAELESKGYIVIGTARNGRQAVEMTRQLRPDVVVMDIAMPEMDGIAAANAIQLECPTPVVILSAHDEADMVEGATAAGVGAFVIKPPDGAELERAIAIAGARHADAMELRSVNRGLQQALAEVKTLRGFLPICCGCKKVRDDAGYWNEVEEYVAQRTDAKFSHGYCPTCLEKYFPGCSAAETG